MRERLALGGGQVVRGLPGQPVHLDFWVGLVRLDRPVPLESVDHWDRSVNQEWLDLPGFRVRLVASGLQEMAEELELLVQLE